MNKATKLIAIFSVGLLLLVPLLPRYLTPAKAATDSPPLLFGWGGILAAGSNHFSTGNPSSHVFTGEQASNTEVTFAEMQSRGYNAARVSVRDPAIGGDAVSYDSGAWVRTLQLAAHYGITVIGDDHGYDCPSTTFWQPVFQDTPQSSYPNVLWETKNEPHCSTLSQDDQAIINLARSMGDTRWFVLGCDSDCSGATPSGFPNVTDPANHVFYDFHEYYFYQYHSGSWSTSDAIAFADEQYRGALYVQQHFGPFLGTEFGADTGCGDPSPGANCPSDQVIPGSAGWSPESLTYLSRLVTDLQNAGIGYTIWNAGDWDDGPVGITGAMDSPSFGNQLPLPPISVTPTPLTASFTFAPTAPTVGQAVAFSASANGGTGPYSYSWSFGDNTQATGASVNHSYLSAGSYTITLNLSDSAGGTATSTRTVAVSPASSANSCSLSDFDHDGRVTIFDVSIFALHYGSQTGQQMYDPAYDLNNDGKIDILDLSLVALAYGQTC